MAKAIITISDLDTPGQLSIEVKFDPDIYNAAGYIDPLKVSNAQAWALKIFQESDEVEVL